MNERLAELVAKFPVPAAKDGKLAEVDKAATDAAVAELVKGGRDAVVGLVGMLNRADVGGDGRARHALHALVIHVAGVKGDPQRTVAGALAAALSEERPPEVQTFILRQLQFAGGKEVTPAV